MMTEEETLALARELIGWGVPVVVCKAKPGTEQMVPIVSWQSITNAKQCEEHLSRYRHGQDALALIGGHGIDIIDVDTKTDPPGSVEPFGAFTNYGVTRTPSGGYHYVIPSTGLRKKQALVVDGQPVGDYIGGLTGEGAADSRMIAYLPGSHRPNKYGDVQYTMDVPWDVEGAVMAGPDVKIREVLEAAGVNDVAPLEVYVDDSPPREPSLGVSQYAQAAVDAELARLDDLPQPWHEGAEWDNTTFQVACRLMELANSNWTGYTHEMALNDLLDHAPSDGRWGQREHMQKWNSARETVGNGGRRDPNDPLLDFHVEPAPIGTNRPGVDVTSPADALDFVFRTIGREGTPLAGLFRRGNDLVFTPRVGEQGYVETPSGQDDGTVQVRWMSNTGFCAYVDKRYRVFKMTRGNGGGQVGALFPAEVGARATAAPELLDALRPLRGVTHTPIVRADGSILMQPGYDDASGMLFLPDRGLRIPRTHRGLDLLLEMIEGFPFVREHSDDEEDAPNHFKANYLAALLTPLMRQLVPPPYPLIAITAPQPGAGKSLLATILQILHGGVMRGEMVRDNAELRKQITSILDSTAAPVVTFDNLTGTLRSSILDSLLTRDTWTDRRLGTPNDITVPNDRLWTLTGNNLALGGDLKRRTIWVTINPKMEHPEKRTGFRHNDLESWVEENRGEILAALLSLVTDWVEAGRPMIRVERTDSFGLWQQTLGSILKHAGVRGTLNHPSTVKEDSLEDEEDAGLFLHALRRTFGGDTWLTSQVVGALQMGDIEATVLPEDLALKISRDTSSGSKALGKWIKAQRERRFGGLTVEEAGFDASKTRLWRVVADDDDLL